VILSKKEQTGKVYDSTRVMLKVSESDPFLCHIRPGEFDDELLNVLVIRTNRSKLHRRV
jgi:hypothetical protein